jgi:hypothetical protein
MRYRLMATYRGVPYEAGIGPSEADVVLFAACPPPEELGFEPATGHWRKQLHIEDVQALWESRPTGRFCGERCIVLDDLGDRLHIAYLGHDAFQAEQLGYWQVDRGVFELITPREEVTDIVEERTDYPGRSTDMLPSASLSTEALDSAALPLAGPADGRQTAAAAPEQNASATRLADLAATTLAHLAAMSAAPGRAAAPGQATGRSPDPAWNPSLDPASDPARSPAWDPSQHAGAPRGGIPADRANGPAVHSAEFAGPVAPDPWLGMPLGSDVAMPLGSEVAMPPPDEQPLPLEAAARRAASAATAAMRRQRRETPREPVAPDAAGTAEPADIPAIADPAGATATADPTGATATAHPAGATATATADPAGITAIADPAGATATAEHADTAGTAGTAEAIGRAPRRQRREAGPPAPDGAPAADGTALSAGSGEPAGTAAPAETPRRRRAARKRVATQGIFSELASLAAIPPSAYAVGEEIDGAMCLVQTEQGFEVFNAAGGARHEARGFTDEESAYFYLFGVLAADAVRTGRLAPRPT